MDIDFWVLHEMLFSLIAEGRVRTTFDPLGRNIVLFIPGEQCEPKIEAN